MSNTQQVSALHRELYELYRGKSTDQVRINKLWFQIEKLEADDGE